jgi:hypothetical protein
MSSNNNRLMECIAPMGQNLLKSSSQILSTADDETIYSVLKGCKLFKLRQEDPNRPVGLPRNKVKPTGRKLHLVKQFRKKLPAKTWLNCSLEERSNIVAAAFLLYDKHVSC